MIVQSNIFKAIQCFELASAVVVDLNENGLAELVRDVRSAEYIGIRILVRMLLC